jgi:hypothetical protein
MEIDMIIRAPKHHWQHGAAVSHEFVDLHDKRWFAGTRTERMQQGDL